MSEQLVGQFDDVHVTAGAFAALRSDGEAIIWGSAEYGAGISKISNSTQMVSSEHLFAVNKRGPDGASRWVVSHPAAMRLDETVCHERYGNLSQVRAGKSVFVLVTCGGEVHACGDGLLLEYGLALKNASSVHSTRNGGFAMVRKDARDVVVWGSQEHGGNGTEMQVRSGVANVSSVVSNAGAFVWLRDDGTALSFGSESYGGDRRALEDVSVVRSTMSAFAALHSNGSVTAWGDPERGGDAQRVKKNLNNIVELRATQESFVCRNASGSLFLWGGTSLLGKQTNSDPSMLTSVSASDDVFMAFTGALSEQAFVLQILLFRDRLSYVVLSLQMRQQAPRQMLHRRGLL